MAHALPNGESQILEDLGHLAHEEDPEQILDIIASFIAKRETSQSDEHAGSFTKSPVTKPVNGLHLSPPLLVAENPGKVKHSLQMFLRETLNNCLHFCYNLLSK